VSDFESKKEVGLKRLTYTHFCHALDITVNAMGDDNQIISLGVGVGRAETTAGM
jgi:hypothetical protein